MMNIRRLPMMMACVALAVPAVALGQAASKPLSTSLGMVAFPVKGQTTQQQSQDEGECYAWAKGQTGVDPMAPPPAAAQPAQQPASTSTSKADGSRVRGAARGAAAGAIVGEVANGDASDGAAIGATVGVVAGGRQSRKNQQQAAEQSAQQQQATQQQQAAQQQQLDLFRKGFAACLEPKGYTVK
jgi:hypothetical protein